MWIFILHNKIVLFFLLRILAIQLRYVSILLSSELALRFDLKWNEKLIESESLSRGILSVSNRYDERT